MIGDKLVKVVWWLYLNMTPAMSLDLQRNMKLLHRPLPDFSYDLGHDTKLAHHLLVKR